MPDSRGVELTEYGQRVGATVLKLTRLTDIISPGASQRAVFVDQGRRPDSDDFYVHYLYPRWRATSPPPIRHAEGATLSMADGHAEYWKWKSRETIAISRASPLGGDPAAADTSLEDRQPRTQDGLYDLQRLQRATWGRLGYPVEESPL